MNFSVNLIKTTFSQKLKIVLFLVSLFSFLSTYAQRDLITTQAGEDIRCKILEETPNRFVYAYLSKGGKVLRNEIFKSLVTDFKYNNYADDLVDSKGRLISVKNEKLAINDVSKTVIKEEKNGGQSEEKRVIKESKKIKNTKTKQIEAGKSEVVSKSLDSKSVASETKSTTHQTNGDVTNTKTSKMADSVKTDPVLTEIKATKTGDKSTIKTTHKAEKKQVGKQPIPRPSADAKIEAQQPEKPVIEKEIATTQVDERKSVSTMPNPETSPLKIPTKFRVGVRGGYASLLKKATLTDEYSKYLQGTQNGWMFGADAAYFPIQNFGFGAMYSNFQASNSATSVKYTSIIDPTKKDITGAISDKSSTKFLGGVLYFRKNIDYKTFLILGVAPGMNFYSNKRTEGTTSIDIKGQQFGGAATLGIDFLMGNDIIGRDIILSLEGGYNYAKFDKLDYGQGALRLENPLDQSHWSITLGLRFTRYPKYLRLTSY